MSKTIAIYGAGGFGREVLTIIEHINAQEKQWDFIGFFDDAPNAGIKDELYLGDINALNAFKDPLNLVLANGNSCTRYEMFQKIQNQSIQFPTLIHPKVILGREKDIDIGRGCVLCAGSILTLDISIADFSIININVSVGHNTRLGSFVSVMPGVNIAGDVSIANQVFIGSGANIINGKKVGEKSKIGSGAVVISDIPANKTAVGVPARIL